MMRVWLQQLKRGTLPLMFAANLGAQATAVSPGAPVCPSGGAPLVDSAEYTVVISAGTAWNRHEYTSAERSRILYHADAVRQRFVPPPTLGSLPVIGEQQLTAWGGAPSGHSAVGGKLVLVMKPNGRLKTTFWQVLPFSKSFAVALHAAVIAADTALDFQAMPPRESGSGEDTLVVQVRSADDVQESDELPLMRVRLARYVLDAPPRVMKEGSLYYPINAGDAGLENRGEMQVFIGSNGRAIMPATQVTRIEWRDFLSTMQRAVEGSVYEAAQSNGCAVPALMIHGFTFRHASRK